MPRTAFVQTTTHYLAWGLRLAAMLLVLLVFGLVGLVDALLCRLSPAWQSRDAVPYQVSDKLVRALLLIFPSLLTSSYFLRSLRQAEGAGVD